MLRKWVIGLVLLFFVPISGWCIYITTHFPYSDFVVKKIDNQWTITEIDQRSQAGKLGVKVGDRVLLVNGEKVDRYPTVVKWGTVDLAKTITISRGDVTFDLKTDTIPTITYIDISFLSAYVICLCVAIITYKWMARSKSSSYLALVFFNIANACMGLGASIRGDSLGKFTIGMSLILIPIVLLQFLLVFLKEKGNVQLYNSFIQKVPKLLYLFCAVCLILHFPLFFEWHITQVIHKHMAPAELMFFSVSIVFDLGMLFHAYIKYKKVNPVVSSMIKTVGGSFAISIVPVVCFSFLPSVLSGHEWFDSLYTSWFILIFPLSFTYLLAAKKIYDIDLVVRRFILTTVISIVPSGIIVAMISTLFSAKGKAEHLVMAFLFILVLLSATLYSLEYLTNRMERIFFPRRHFLQVALKKIAKKLGLIHSIRDLNDIILSDIVEILQVSGGAIIFRYNSFTESISEGEIDIGEAEALIKEGREDHPSLTSFEITRNDEYSSHLVLTAKKSNTMLGAEETQWLNLIISYLAVSLENLYLIRKLTVRMEQLAAQIPNEEAGEFAWFRKIMFELQEKERSRIATDLHDTTMQDLFFLKRRIVSLYDRMRNEDASDALDGVLEYIDVINMNLRQSCFELHPYLLQEVGLVGTIEKLLDLERMVVPFEIEFRSFGRDIIEASDMETKRHLFRVVQELLNNAKKHSEAKNVKIQLKVVQSNIMLLYEDDGVGFESDRTVPREIGGSRMGLEQMKSRILSLNGYFDLITSKGKGMRFAATLPLKEGMTA